jgi:hypothetical protein
MAKITILKAGRGQEFLKEFFKIQSIVKIL